MKGSVRMTNHLTRCYRQIEDYYGAHFRRWILYLSYLAHIVVQALLQARMHSKFQPLLLALQVWHLRASNRAAMLLAEAEYRRITDE
jgi:hypothetical protein